MNFSRHHINKSIQVFFTLFYGIAIILLGYFTQRTESYKLFSLFGFMFLIYWYFTTQKLSLQFIVITGLALRLTQLLMLPNLSDDYFRFIWDGELLHNGINPFYYLPSYFKELDNFPGALDESIYHQLNSPNYFTIYPPVCQFSFWISSLFIAKGSIYTVVTMRLFIFAAEIGTLALLPKLLSMLSLAKEKTKWYALNPLVIVELTGNLHYEALMIFFLTLALYLIGISKLSLSAVSFSLSVGSKLLPLMFLPLVFFYFGWKKAITYYLILGISLAILFVGFLDLEMIQNLGDSINLYFKKFEFNASIYYIVRWFGFQTKGYNIIEAAGIRLTFIPITFILLMSFNKSRDLTNIVQKMLFALSIYFFTATIVHPWYITTLVFLSIFTNYKFAIVWSGMAILSYATYRDTNYEEVLLLTTLEYTFVYILLFYELYRNNILDTIRKYFLSLLNDIKKPSI